jgi:hypothetical protein
MWESSIIYRPLQQRKNTPYLPDEESNTLEITGACSIAKAWLLRDGTKLTFVGKEGNWLLSIPQEKRTNSVDIVAFIIEAIY